MHIHTVRAGDTIFKIAREYSVSPMKIIENNELLNPDKLAVGQKLLILTPTRTYNVRGSDNLDRIADRFNVRRGELLARNPYLSGTSKIYPGQILAVKYDTPTYAAAYANGYLFNEPSEERLSLTLPYLTYITLAFGKRENGKIKRLIDGEDVLRTARENKKIPLMRIYDKDSEFSDSYIEELATLAREHGFGGITMAAYTAMRENPEGYAQFLMKLKKRLMEDDLLLFAEIDGNRAERLPELCDGYVVMYEKCCLDDIPSFEDGEGALMNELALSGEAAKTYIDLSSFGYMGDEEITMRDAENLAYSAGKEILYDEDKKICSFHYNKYLGGKRESVRVAFESLENIKAKLDLIGELGFMGVSFDIMKVPVGYLMLFETTFNRPVF